MPETMRNHDPLAQRQYLYDDDLETEDDLDNEFSNDGSDDDEEDESFEPEDDD